MRKKILLYFKYILTTLGAQIPANIIHQFQMCVNYMRLGRWMKKNNFHIPCRHATRNMVFSKVATRLENENVLYLEFGVFTGISMRFWSNSLMHPQTQLHGFDSFEGLPEDFDVDGPYVRGTFDVKGQIPKFDDKRVKFYKGWFNETLPTYVAPPHDF